MKTVYSITIIFVLIALVSCERDIDFQVQDTQPEIVINAIVGNDSIFKIKVDRSNVSLSESSQSKIDSSEFIVELYENDKFIETLNPYYYRYFNNAYHGNGETMDSLFEYEKYYISDCVAQSGQEYTLKASHPNYATAQASHKVPLPIKITKVDTINYINGATGKISDISFILKFNDPANEENYYRIYYRSMFGLKVPANNEHYDSLSQQIVFFKNQEDALDIVSPFITPEKDANSIMFGTPYNQFNLFTDELFDGNECSIEINMKTQWYRDVDLTKLDIEHGEFFWIEFYLLNITKETYLYLQSVDKLLYNGLDYFNEPVIVYENIENGVGFFGAYAADTAVETFGVYPSHKYNYIQGSQYWEWF